MCVCGYVCVCVCVCVYGCIPMCDRRGGVLVCGMALGGLNLVTRSFGGYCMALQGFYQKCPGWFWVIVFDINGVREFFH